MNSTDICNMALGAIGQGRIASLDEESEQARNCRMFYDMVRQNLLTTYVWEFAQRQAKLALMDVETMGWNFTYAYPAAALVVRNVFDKDFAWRKDDYTKEFTIVAVNETQKGICTNIENAYCEYTADVENASIFPPAFQQTLVYSLAASLAYPLCGSSNLQQINYQMAQNALMQAKFVSAIQDEHKPSLPNRYWKARM